MTPGHWSIHPVTPSLVGKTVIVGMHTDHTLTGMVVDVDGLIVTVRDEYLELHEIDTSAGKHIWVRVS